MALYMYLLVLMLRKHTVVQIIANGHHCYIHVYCYTCTRHGMQADLQWYM